MSRPNQSGIRRKILVTIAALGLLAMLGVCYYYYFSRKEQRMEERNFRVLHRIEENFGRRLQDYRQRFISSARVCGNQKGKTNTVDLECLRKNLGGDEGIQVDTQMTPPKVSWQFDQSGQVSVIAFYLSNHEVFDEGAKLPYFKITVPSESVLESVLRYDVFPSYHLRAQNGAAYNNCPEVCDLVHPDSLSKTDNVQILNIGAGRYYVFSHPFSLAGGQGIVLSGLLSGERYGQEKFNVPGNFLLGVFLLLLVILLSFPFIKSFLVSPEETLRVPDVLMALLSLFLLCYMFTFIHLSMFSSTRDERAKQRMLEQTTDSLSASFATEICRMRDQLREFDKYYWNHFDSNGHSFTPAVPVPTATIYPNFFRAFWLDKNGNQIRLIDKSHDTFTIQARNYKDREYFKAVSQNQLWFPDSGESKRVYLEPVYSRTDGTFRAVLGMKSENGPLYPVISSDLRSVIDPVLPREVDFCLLDAAGNILFTSTGVEHLRENFPEECDFSAGVTDAINSRSSRFMNQSFMGRDCMILIKPLNGLPLHLVTLTYNEYSGNTLLQVCIYTSLFILAILVVFSLVVFLLVFLTRKSSNPLVHKPYLDISLLFPASRYLYSDFGGILSNLLLMIAVSIAAYVSRDNPCTLVALLLLCASGTTATFCYARIEAERSRLRVFWMLTILCFVFVDLLLLQIDKAENFSSITCLVLFEILLILDTLTLRKLHLYEVSMLSDNGQINDQSKEDNGIVLALVRFQHWFKDGFERWTGHKLRFYNQYAFMLVTWFFLATVISSVFMFRYVYRNELEYRIRSAQIDIARKIYDQKSHSSSNINVNPNHLPLPDVKTYLDGYFSTKLSTDTSRVPGLRNQERIFDRLLETYRLSWNKGFSSRGTEATPADDNSINIGREDGTLLLNYQNLLNRPEDSINNHVRISSSIPGFPFPHLDRSNFIRFAWFYLAPFAFLVLFFYAINFFLKRFFLFTLLPRERSGDAKLFEHFYEKYQDSSFKLIILGVTASGKRELALKLSTFVHAQERARIAAAAEFGESTKPDDAHLYFLDLAEIEDTLQEIPKITIQKGDIVVLNHFEHNLSEKETNDKKFEIISTLSSRCEKVLAHLVILTNIHPSVFLKNQKAKAESGSFDAEDYINTQDYYNWTGLLSGFQIYIKSYPEKKSGKFETHEESTELYNKTKSWYLYYLSIWNSLERIEKFVAYDLATDGLVNYRNQAALYSLYTKGLVVMKDVPELMNEEFRTFILTEVSESDVELEKRQGGNRSAWDMFRIPFLVVVFAALMFVFLTQQETFNKLMAGLAAVAGSVPLLIRLFTQEKKPA